MNSIFVILFYLFFIFGYLHASAPYSSIENLATTKILTPALAKQETAKIRLSNGLEAYLISMPTANQSGAVMSVKVGSWEDPEEYPGLAHFLEHMLFLGTKKYPQESEFDRFITEHGGENNAFTENNKTSYIFTVNHTVFEEALDRFASFFKEPTFNPSGIARELNAIDQEYAKNLQNDYFRELYVYKELLNSEHPLHRFNIGNSVTLSTVARDTLEEWYKNHYSANLMQLVVYSSLPLEKLKQLVVDKFNDIQNSNKISPVFKLPALKSEESNQYVFIEPIKNTKSVSLIWELPTKFFDLKDSQPETMVCYVLGDEGENSLLAQLKRESLAENLSCGALRQGEKLQHFYVNIELTSLGLRKIETVILRCFQAIKNLKEKEFPSYLFEEIQNIAKIRYQYQSTENEFRMLMEQAKMLHGENLSTYPEQTLIPQKFSSQDIQELLKVLTPQNAHIFITAPTSETGVTVNKTEKWFGVNYTLKPIPQDSIAKWISATPHSNINLPLPNIFIPHNLSIINEMNSTYQLPQPKLLVDNDFARIYFAPDNYYQTPSISWTVQILTPKISMDDPAKIVFGDLLVKYLEDALINNSYPAKLAGLEYQIQRGNNGIKLELNGYSDNAPLLLKEFVSVASNLQVSVEKFPIFKDSLMREYQNFTKESPLEQCFELLKSVLYENFVTEKQKAAALRKISFETFSSSLASLWNETYVEGLFYGNISEERTKTLTEHVIQNFQKGSYPAEKQFHQKVLILSKEEGPYYLEAQTQAQGNGVILAIQDDAFSFKNRAAQQILMQAIKEPFFSELRTKQQTGYIVYSAGQEIERKLFDIFVVQSNTHNVRDLLARFEAFLEVYVREIGVSELNEEQFLNIKQSLIDQLKCPLSNMKAVGSLLASLAFDYDGDFKWIAKRIEGMQNLTFPEFIHLSQKMLGKQNKQRLGVLLKGVITNSLQYTKAGSLKILRNSGRYAGKED
jgi:insulysin